MVHVRGARSDYGEWVRHGAERWGWDDVLPIFLRMENFDGGVSELHGVGGLMSIVSRYALAPVHEAIIAAAQEVGIARNDDYNSGELDGVAQAQLTIPDGRACTAPPPPTCGRSSTRPTYGVVTGATARRLLVQGTRCVGVEWEHSGRLHTARATSGVVVSAGAIASPKLLLLSGIGPGPELAAHGIDVVLDPPGVGRNLHDHLLSPSIHAAWSATPSSATGLPPIQTHLVVAQPPGPAGDTQPVHFSVPLRAVDGGPAEWLHPAGGTCPPREPRLDPAQRSRPGRPAADRSQRLRGLPPTSRASRPRSPRYARSRRRHRSATSGPPARFTPGPRCARRLR